LGRAARAAEAPGEWLLLPPLLLLLQLARLPLLLPRRRLCGQALAALSGFSAPRRGR